MRASGILIMVGGLALGVGLAILLTMPGTSKNRASTGADPVPPTVTDAPVRAPEVEPEKKTVDDGPPEESQRTELEGGLAVGWQRGRAGISGWQDQKPIWSQELAFPIADVVKGSAKNEVKVVSVDALQSVMLDVASGAVKGAPAPEGQGGDDPVAGLLAEVKTLHADGLAKMRAGDGKATLAICAKMGELAGKLAEAKRPNEAFRIWAAAKKLRRAVAPELIGKELPKEQQPGPEDLEF
jgi:hypothetical protein